jgi:hypothetical protein
MHALGRQGFYFGLDVHAAKNLAGRARYVGSTTDLERVTPADDIDAQSALELPQVLIERAAHICQSLIVGGLEPYVVNGGEILLGLNAQLG